MFTCKIYTIMKKLKFLTILSALIALFSLSGCSKVELTGTLKVTVYDSSEDHFIQVYPWGEGGKSIRQGTIEKGKDRSISFELNMGNYNVDCDGYYKSVQVRPGMDVELIFKD